MIRSRAVLGDPAEQTPARLRRLKDAAMEVVRQSTVVGAFASASAEAAAEEEAHRRRRAMFMEEDEEEEEEEEEGEGEALPRHSRGGHHIKGAAMAVLRQSMVARSFASRSAGGAQAAEEERLEDEKRRRRRAMLLGGP